MSDYQRFLQERERIDFFLEKGYRIAKVTEDLNGALIDFEKLNTKADEAVTETLHISTANARKYFTVKLIEQQAVNLVK